MTLLDAHPVAVDLRPLFRRHPSGVAVVTAAGPDGPVGFTATSLASVSADPPLLSFNLSRTASSWPAVTRATHVGVHLLGQGDAALATRFSRSGIDRFAPPTRFAAGPAGVPVLHGVAAWAVAEVRHLVTAGDHTLVLAEVRHAVAEGPGGDPLLWHDGAFAGLSREAVA